VHNDLSNINVDHVNTMNTRTHQH